MVDLSPMIKSLKFYRPLRTDPALFRTVHLIEEGTIIVWGDNDQIDMAADSVEQLAEESMTADDFRDFLKSNNLTHNDVAALLGYSRRQIENFLAGELIPRVVVMACFGLIARKQRLAESQTSPTIKFIEPEPTTRVAKISFAKPIISKLPNGTTVEAFADAA